MKYDLLVVGNGFDLGCKYKTSYINFLDSFYGRSINNYLISFFTSAYNNGVVQNQNWNGFENLLCQYLQFLDYLFNNEDNVERYFSEKEEDSMGRTLHRYYYFKIINISKLPQNLYLLLTIVNPLDDVFTVSTTPSFGNRFSRIDDYPDAKELYFRVFVRLYLVNAFKKNVINMILKKLEEKLQNLEDELKKYIASVTAVKADLPPSLLNSSADRILSFNYSKTAQTMFNLDDEKVAYVHGNIDSDIVVGVEQSMIEGQTFKEQSDFAIFFKRFRRILKNCNKRYNHKIINQLNPDSIIGIYGHSLDLADKSLLYPLFANKYKKYFIYCFKETDSYKFKLVNLLGLDLYDELEKDDRIVLLKVQ